MAKAAGVASAMLLLTPKAGWAHCGVVGAAQAWRFRVCRAIALQNCLPQQYRKDLPACQRSAL